MASAALTGHNAIRDPAQRRPIADSVLRNSLPMIRDSAAMRRCRSVWPRGTLGVETPSVGPFRYRQFVPQIRYAEDLEEDRATCWVPDALGEGDLLNLV